MTNREAMELALEALNQATGMCAERTSTRRDIDEAMAALRKALEQEPWDTPDMAYRPGGLSMEHAPVTWRNAAIRLGEDLYSVGPNGYYNMTASQWLDWALSVVNTAPPKSEWVGLTDDEMLALIAYEPHPLANRTAIINAVERLLKEKNT